MAKNFGKMHMKMIEIPPVHFFKVHPDDPDVVMIPARLVGQTVSSADETPWRDLSKGSEGPGKWFIAVSPEGWVYSAEQDPSMLGISDADFWVINHPGPAEAIRAHKWTGKEVVDWPVPEAPDGNN